LYGIFAAGVKDFVRAGAQAPKETQVFDYRRAFTVGGTL
jgi:hypothetical protein